MSALSSLISTAQEVEEAPETPTEALYRETLEYIVYRMEQLPDFKAEMSVKDLSENIEQLSRTLDGIESECLSAMSKADKMRAPREVHGQN